MTTAPRPAVVFKASRQYLIARLAAIQRFIGRNAFATSAEGATVELSDGRRVIDLGTWATTVLGHRPPAVVAAVVDQCQSLPAAARGLANPVAPLLAERLVALAQPSRLQRAWFGANGADVVEAALKLARVETGRMRVLAVEGGFHGRTLGAAAVSDADRYRDALSPLLGHVTFVAPEPDAVEREVESGDVAAVIFEVVQGSGHAVPLPVETLRRWSEAAHEAGVMVIADEIQTGLWRCGEFSLALAAGIDPDAVLFGKTLGGGVVPLSAALFAPALVEQLDANPQLHSQTFSGHPLACAAGLATLDALPRAVAENADRIGRWLSQLRAEVIEHPHTVTRAETCGLMMSLGFASAELASQFVVAAAHKGLLVCPSDGDRSVVRLLAPLVLDDSQMARARAIVTELCADPARWPTRVGAPRSAR